MENGTDFFRTRAGHRVTGVRSTRSQHRAGAAHRRRLLTVVSAASLVGSMIVFPAVSEAGAAPSAAPTITNFPRQALAPSLGARNTWAASNCRATPRPGPTPD